ncbi:MAG: 2Fe-2S iron-sulfur cluster binding domain-containing protein, partial [Anaerolineales bacterium]|nr:2Fe-2S iron-sulfur cluster binding domain-containing protein [Anaerolineales bacterium]
MSGKLVDKQSHMVIFMPSGRRGLVPAGTTVLEASRDLGVPIASICGGHMTCNKCLVKLEAGEFAKHGITSADDHLSPASTPEIALLTELDSPDCRLSCQARIT